MILLLWSLGKRKMPPDPLYCTFKAIKTEQKKYFFCGYDAQYENVYLSYLSRRG